MHESLREELARHDSCRQTLPRHPSAWTSTPGRSPVTKAALISYVPELTAAVFRGVFLPPFVRKLATPSKRNPLLQGVDHFSTTGGKKNPLAVFAKVRLGGVHEVIDLRIWVKSKHRRGPRPNPTHEPRRAPVASCAVLPAALKKQHCDYVVNNTRNMDWPAHSRDKAYQQQNTMSMYVVINTRIWIGQLTPETRPASSKTPCQSTTLPFVKT